MIEPYLTTRELADRLKLSENTLRAWRHRGEGPRYVKLGKHKASHVRYMLSDVIKWELQLAA